MEPMEWVAIARTLWAHRRKVYAGAAMLAPFALTAMLLVFVLFAGGAASPAAAVLTPQCQHQLQSQGISADTGMSFGPGPVNNGKAVIAAGLQMKIPEKGIIVGLATALQESGLRNLANPNVPASLGIPHEGLGHDHLSVGIMQQQPWWGSLRDLMTPGVAAQKFFTALLKIGGWQNMAPTVAAQSVQHSEFPDAYADDVAAATLFYRQHLREVLATSGRSRPTGARRRRHRPRRVRRRAGSRRQRAAARALPPAWRPRVSPNPRSGCHMSGAADRSTGRPAEASTARVWCATPSSKPRAIASCLPRETYDMVHYGRIVARTAVQPGDLVFSEPGPAWPRPRRHGRQPNHHRRSPNLRRPRQALPVSRPLRRHQTRSLTRKPITMNTAQPSTPARRIAAWWPRIPRRALLGVAGALTAVAALVWQHHSDAAAKPHRAALSRQRARIAGGRRTSDAAAPRVDSSRRQRSPPTRPRRMPPTPQRNGSRPTSAPPTATATTGWRGSAAMCLPSWPSSTGSPTSAT